MRLGRGIRVMEQTDPLELRGESAAESLVFTLQIEAGWAVAGRGMRDPFRTHSPAQGQESAREEKFV